CPRKGDRPMIRTVLAALALTMGGNAMVLAGDKPTDDGRPALKSVVGSNNQFALALYAKLRDHKGNLFFSPYSISDALAMTSAGAQGGTLAEMEKTLHFTLDQENLPGAFQELIETLNGDSKKRRYQLSVANALWGQKDLQFLPRFVRITEDNYHAGL